MPGSFFSIPCSISPSSFFLTFRFPTPPLPFYATFRFLIFFQIAVEPLSIPETLEVARKRYPDLPTPALKRLLHTMVVARGPTASGHRGGFGFASRSSAGREPGVRDFLKLCSRVEVLGVFDSVDEMDDGDDSVDGGDGGDDLRDVGGWFCSEGQALPAVVESLDVFAGHLTTKVRLFFLRVFLRITGLISPHYVQRWSSFSMIFHTWHVVLFCVGLIFASDNIFCFA